MAGFRVFSSVFLVFLALVGAARGQSNNNTTNANTLSVEVLVRCHGAGMIVAWGILVPFAMSIALMGKGICPGKGYYYTHMTSMILALVLVIVSIVVILIHAEGKWLNTVEPLSNPHKIMGIISFIVLVLNPFFAILTPKELSKWRPLFNLAHGGAGFFIGLISALCAMLIGASMIPHMTKDEHQARQMLRSLSGMVGYIVLLLAIYNIYPIRYHKDIPEPFVVPAMIKLHRQNQGVVEMDTGDDDDDGIPLESSPDSTYRVVAMVVSLIPIPVLAIVAISYLAILN